MESRSVYCKVTKNQFMLYLLFLVLIAGIIMTILDYPFVVISGNYFNLYDMNVLMFYIGIIISISMGLLIIITLIKCSDD